MIDIDMNIGKKNLTEVDITNLWNESFQLSRAQKEVFNRDPSEWGLSCSCMFLYILLKFYFTGLTLSCPVPGGIFTPTFTLGSVVGQLYINIVI